MLDHSHLGRWAELAHVRVPGNPNAKSREEDPQMDSWRQVAILAPEPVGHFYIGFISEFSPIPEFNRAVCKRPQIGMRLGPEDVTFVAMAGTGRAPLKLNLITVADIDDPRWAHIAFR